MNNLFCQSKDGDKLRQHCQETSRKCTWGTKGLHHKNFQIIHKLYFFNNSNEIISFD